MSTGAFPMLPEEELETVEPTSAHRASFWRDVVLRQQGRRSRGIIILVFFTFVAIFEHQLAPYNPREQVGRCTRRPTRSTGWAPTTAATTCCRW